MPSRTVRLSAQAELDFANIVAFTAETFGARQARRYATLITEAAGALAEGPAPPGSREREEIGPGVRTLHIARRGRLARHFLVYRLGADGAVEIARILHDSMELRRHLTNFEGAP